MKQLKDAILRQSEFEKYKFLRNELDKQDKDNKKSKD